MARRHSAKPAKARPKKPRVLNRGDAKVARWDKPDDIPLDEEDQFHTSRDKILLGGDDYGEDEDGDEDEVFALKGVPASESEDEEDEDEDEMEEDPHPAKAKQKSKGKKDKKGRKPRDSDEEEDEEDEEEEESWGKKKSAYYSSNAAELDSDDEEAHEMEEAEARRLQAKLRDTLTDDDFGLADARALAASGAFAKDAEDPFAEPVPSVETPVLDAGTVDKNAILRRLEKDSPETLALARDWEDVAHSLVKSQAKLAKLQTETPDALSLGMVHLHHQALLTYATTLAFYLHLRASPQYAQKPEQLRAHPVLQRLLTLKQSLSTLEDLDFNLSDDEEADDDGDPLDMDEDLDDLDFMADAEQLWSGLRRKGLDDDELAGLLEDAALDEPLEHSRHASRKNAAPEHDPSSKIDKKTKKKAKAETVSEPPAKKRKTAASVTFDLVEPEFVSSVSRPAAHNADTDADVYGETHALHRADAADKQARKKSLQFYAATVERSSARREGARAAFGGDDDLPYRARKKEPKVAKAERGQGGADLDDAEPALRAGTKRARDADGMDVDEDMGSGGSDSDGYYSLVQRTSKAKKEKKKAEHDEAKLAARAALAEAEDDASGPRSLTRAILKNKGLTPTRPKDVRNPRVKKRKKFEKAKRKVSSQRAVYKGGLADTGGRYEGERSGISKVVKSTRL